MNTTQLSAQTLPEHYPEKLGLKLEINQMELKRLDSSRALSRKIRIETEIPIYSACRVINLPEHYPEKLGLKLKKFDVSKTVRFSSRALSRKIRIETNPKTRLAAAISGFQSIIQKN